MNRDRIFKRIVITLVGMAIVGLGVSGMVYSGYGVDPSSVFGTGIGNVLGVTTGQGFIATNIGMLVLALIVDKKWIDLGTFIGVFWLGFATDLATEFWMKVFPDPSLWNNIFLSLSGTLLLALGVAIYTNGDLGIAAGDIPPEILSDKLNIKYGKTRIFTDICYVILGYFLGGELGMGTIVAAFATGPLVQYLRPRIRQACNLPVAFES